MLAASESGVAHRRAWIPLIAEGSSSTTHLVPLRCERTKCTRDPSGEEKEVHPLSVSDPADGSVIQSNVARWKRWP